MIDTGFSGVAEALPSPYRELGLRPYINAAGVRTQHGGSLMPPAVLTQMAAAAREFVDMDELMTAAGARIASLTGAQWGMVTAGSSAAITLVTAACIAGNDPARMLRLPASSEQPTVLMPAAHRFAYDHAVRFAGARIEVFETGEDLMRGLGDGACMVLLLGSQEAGSSLRLEAISALAQQSGAPVVVDAAPEFLERPNPWLARGADLVIYSGGKYLQGPQGSGLLLGRRNLVEAAWRHASPHLALGRGFKVSKEDVIGLLTALRLWFERDPEADRVRWDADLTTIADRLAPYGVAASVVTASAGAAPAKLKIAWDGASLGIDGAGLWRGLLDGEPRVVLRELSAIGNAVEIDPFCLQPGEAVIVADRIRAVLASAKQTVPSPDKGGRIPNYAGEWRVRVDFLHGARAFELRLTQDGDRLHGDHRSTTVSGAVCGCIRGPTVKLTLSADVEGRTALYQLIGTAEGADLTGDVILGTGKPAWEGPDLSAGQFGRARFHARRETGAGPSQGFERPLQ